MGSEHLEQGTIRTAAQLRVQLAQMTLASQMLERSVRDGEGRERLAALNQAICRMLRIVDRMELACRLEAGSPRMELEAVDLARVVRELGDEMEDLLAGAGVALTVQCPERLTALADERLVRQMLLELVSNGAKAGRNVALALSRRGESAMLTVTDDGPGVPPERMEALFGREEGDLPDWRQSGRGVVIAKRIAQLHGGRLMADPTPNRGLRIAVAIPLRRDEAGRHLESPSLQWDRGGFSDVLVGLSDLLPARMFAPEEDE